MRKAAPAQVFVHLGVARAVLLTLIVALFAIRLIGNMEIRLLRPHNGKQAVDATTVRAMGKLRQNAVLASTDGPMDNVLKFKPPMVFGRREADLLCAALETAFADLKKI